jgi:RNA polymerase sigma factor (sigma-70 family)
MSPVLRFVRRLGGIEAGDEAADAHLLERFVSHRDEEAFAVLVRRHGPMVLNVCLRILHDLHDAEDAFQATFLVLARKAGAIRRRERLGPWLHGVAQRTALKARSNAARWQEIESAADGSAAEPLSELAWRELRLVLDEEIGRLPTRYRAPVILCYLEGLSYAEAARQLGCPAGTVSGRLARARELLRGRLARRGFGLSAALLGTLLPASASAAVPVPLLDATVQAAAHVTRQTLAAGIVTAPVAALAEGVIQAMLWTKLKITVAVLVVAGLAGASGLVYRTQAADDPKQQPGPVAVQKLPPQKPAALSDAKQPPAKPAALPDPKQAAEKAAQAEQEKLLRLRIAELQQLEAQQEALRARLELARARLAELQAVQDRERQRALNLIEQGLNQLRKTGGNDKAITEFDKAFQQLKQQLVRRNIKPKPAGQPEGVVNTVGDFDLVRITIQNGVEAQRGQVLHVYRLEPEPMYLGKLTVVSVRGKEVVGKIQAKNSKQAIKRNDRVSVISPE